MRGFVGVDTMRELHERGARPQVREHAPDGAIADAAGALAADLQAIRGEATAPDEVTVLHAHVARQVVLAAADACDAAAAAALQAAIDSLERRRAAEAEAATLEEQPSEAEAPPPTPGAGKAGKAGKGGLFARCVCMRSSLSSRVLYGA